MKNPKTASQPHFAFHIFALGAILLLGTLIYSNTFQAPLHFDDLKQLSEDYAIRQFPQIKPIWDYSKTRFITYLTLAVNYYFHRLEVFGYHAVNLTIHLLNAVLVYAWVSLIFKAPSLQKNPLGAQARWVALFAALLFTVHPVQTQAVTYIIQRAASLAALFYLSTVVFYFCWKIARRRIFYFLALSLNAAAMFTKETAFTLPFALVLCELIFFPAASGNPKKTALSLLPFLAAAMIIPFIVVSTGAGHGTSLLDLPRETQRISRAEYFLTQLNVLRTYLRLFLFPAGQNLDYDYPISRHFLEHGTWLSFLLLSALFTGALSNLKRAPLTAFGILWFFLTLSVESSLIPIRDVIFEHRLYLPMPGLSLALSAGLFSLIKSGKKCAALFTVLLGLFSWVTYSRNELWKDDIRLWQDVARKSPRKARAYHNLAFLYSARGQYEKALEYGAKAVELDPEKAGSALMTIGVAYGRMGSVDKEIDYYEKAFDFGVDHPAKYYNNLGAAYGKKGDLDRAIENFMKAISADPSYPPSFNNLGFAFDQKGEYDKAIELYQKAIALDPHFAEAYNHMGIAYGKKGEVRKTIEYCTKAVQLNPKYADAYNNLGVAYGLLGDFEKRIHYYELAVATDPYYVRGYANLASAYSQKGDLPKAQEYAAKAAALGKR